MKLLNLISDTLLGTRHHAHIFQRAELENVDYRPDDGESGCLDGFIYSCTAAKRWPMTNYDEQTVQLQSDCEKCNSCDFDEPVDTLTELCVSVSDSEMPSSTFPAVFHTTIILSAIP